MNQVDFRAALMNRNISNEPQHRNQSQTQQLIPRYQQQQRQQQPKPESRHSQDGQHRQQHQTQQQPQSKLQRRSKQLPKRQSQKKEQKLQQPAKLQEPQVQQNQQVERLKLQKQQQEFIRQQELLQQEQLTSDRLKLEQLRIEQVREHQQRIKQQQQLHQQQELLHQQHQYGHQLHSYQHRQHDLQQPCKQLYVQQNNNSIALTSLLTTNPQKLLQYSSADERNGLAPTTKQYDKIKKSSPQHENDPQHQCENSYKLFDDNCTFTLETAIKSSCDKPMQFSYFNHILVKDNHKTFMSNMFIDYSDGFEQFSSNYTSRLIDSESVVQSFSYFTENSSLTSFYSSFESNNLKQCTVVGFPNYYNYINPLEAVPDIFDSWRPGCPYFEIVVPRITNVVNDEWEAKVLQELNEDKNFAILTSPIFIDLPLYLQEYLIAERTFLSDQRSYTLEQNSKALSQECISLKNQESIDKAQEVLQHNLNSHSAGNECNINIKTMSVVKEFDCNRKSNDNRFAILPINLINEPKILSSIEASNTVSMAEEKNIKITSLELEVKKNLKIYNDSWNVETLQEKV